MHTFTIPTLHHHTIALTSWLKYTCRVEGGAISSIAVEWKPGQLQSRDGSFVTRLWRNVSLKIWATAEDLPKTAHAMSSLKAAMKWEEDVFGLEYDLDLFNIVVVADFNMGAMETKSLKIVSIQCSPETASDRDYARTQGVISHEYFHNWTGNRVTCRDWFQLSLKKGLTVFWDQEFSSDMGSRLYDHILILRWPTSTPLRFIERELKLSGLAQVVRMYKTLLGSQGFRRGMDLYFKRHDGQAVTCEEFYAAMRDAKDADFANFLQWYSQSGTPTVKEVKEPMLIPVVVGLLDSNGKDMHLTSVYGDGVLQMVSADGQPAYTTVLQITKKEEEFVFSEISERPVPSLLRGYSAPTLCMGSETYLLTVAWIKNSLLRQLICLGRGDHGHVDIADSFIMKHLASELKAEFLKMVENNRSSDPYVFNHFNVSRRALKNIALSYLATLEDAQITELALNEYKTSTNMTDQFAALTALVQNHGKTRDDVLADFYGKWEHDYLVVNKWFGIQAIADIPGNVENVRKQLKHPAFDLRNPIKIPTFGYECLCLLVHSIMGSVYFIERQNENAAQLESKTHDEKPVEESIVEASTEPVVQRQPQNVIADSDISDEKKRKLDSALVVGPDATPLADGSRTPGSSVVMKVLLRSRNVVEDLERAVVDGIRSRRGRMISFSSDPPVSHGYRSPQTTYTGAKDLPPNDTLVNAAAAVADVKLVGDVHIAGSSPWHFPTPLEHNSGPER
ncbi:hypothetical protein C5167_004793 [Papaver somniferum]|uniref:Peptidase M1 membrane alanine aminopeptidase domain-containing protein n=1 Tax=Papaver somniferum TaxID=3469 RepID=A0A4Y7JBW7_PAPSO|nr:hypothetical protein C5167_004793 [Papaver somniferum]